MLNHPTLDKLRTLRLSGMLAALEEQQQMPEIDALSFEERLGLLADREITVRDNRRFTHRLRRAQLRHHAVLEDLDYQHQRGLDKALMARLAASAASTPVAPRRAQEACRPRHSTARTRGSARRAGRTARRARRPLSFCRCPVASPLSPRDSSLTGGP